VVLGHLSLDLITEIWVDTTGFVIRLAIGNCVANVITVLRIVL
jgi:hypothetical protein